MFLPVTIITTLVNGAIGLLVLLRGPTRTINKLFLLLTISLIGWILTLYWYYVTTSQTLVLTVGRLNFVASLLFAYIFYLFCYYFPVPSFTLHRIIQYALGATIGMLSFIIQYTPLVDQQEIINGEERIVEYGPLFNLYIGVFIILCITGLLLLFVKYRRLKGFLRFQIYYLYMGFLLAIIGAVVTNFVLPYFFHLYWLQTTGPLFTIFIVGFASYAIVKHKLLDIRFLSLRLFIYVVSLTIVTGGTIAMIYGATATLFHFPFSRETFSIMIVFIPLSILIWPSIQNFFAHATYKYLYKLPYDVDATVRALNKIIARTLHLEDLTESLFHLFATTIRPAYMGIQVSKHGQLWSLDTDNNRLLPFDKDKLNHLTELAAQEKTHLLVFDDLEESDTKETMRSLNCSVVMALKFRKDIIGGLVFREKTSGDPYSSMDIQVLSLAAHELAVAINNSLEYHEIQLFTITLQEEVARATTELRTANEHLKQLDKLKDEFIAIASHDLRTPLSAMKGYLWLMMNDATNPLSSVMLDRVKRIYNSTEHMISLLNDMLDVSRIESGRFQLTIETIDIHGAIAEVVEELKHMAEEKHIDLRCTNNEHYTVQADKHRLREILVNLIDNAIKYTHTNGSVQISYEKKDARIQISVTDTGVGIDQKDMPILFTKFGQIGDKMTKSAHTSSGLGLYICKQLIERHGGTIGVTSTKEKGSSFYFLLPIA